jgi:hypothetical protein
MAGRDNPRVFTVSGIRSLVGEVESLREAGYESGDILPVVTLGAQQQRSAGTTSTSYTDLGQLGEAAIIFEDIADPENTYAALGARLVPDSGEEAYYRWVNKDDGDDRIGPEVSTDTPEQVWSGWAKYDPQTEDNPVLLKVQGKTDPGTNSSSIRSPLLYIGVQL